MTAARLLLVDNYDSFTWNLVHRLEELGASVQVVLNDRISPQAVLGGGFDAVVISPGPGRPEHAGICLDLVRAVAGRLPVLGVCLGHQVIAQAFGARIVRAAELVHGKASAILHDGTGLFRGLPVPFAAARYHSLVVSRTSLSAELVVHASTQDGTIMALCHHRLPLYGVQFHPESILTVEGKALLANFLGLVDRWRRIHPAA